MIVNTNKLKPILQLNKGHYFNYDDPDSSNYDIEDVALGLSREARSNGHTSEFFSVAQHCVMVSHIVPDHLALEGLLHDMSESVMKDCPKPLKILIPGYVEIEHRVEASMAKKFGIKFPFDKEIKVADTICFVTEKRDLSPDSKLDKMYKNIKPLDETIVPWSSKVAYKKFMQRYNQLTKVALKKEKK